MFIDALLRVANAQAFGAAAVSASSIDLGLTTPKRHIGTGEPMGFGIAITTTATVAPVLVEVISATDAALTAGIVVESSIIIPLASAVAGALFFVPIPQGRPNQQFLGVRLTTAGGTVSASAWLSKHDSFSVPPESYAKNYAV